MPNYSSSSVNAVDWAMSFHAYDTVKTRNLLDDIQILPSTPSSTPIPPPFQHFIMITNAKKCRDTSLNINGIEHCQTLAHQIPSTLLDHTTYKYGKIRARPLVHFQYCQRNIWTQTINSSATNLQINVNLINKYFAKQTKQVNKFTRSSTSTIYQTFQILDQSYQMIYDITMRHLLQLLSKLSQQTVTIDDIIHGINTGNINSECLQCVQRLYQILTKQFLKRPDDKIKFETYSFDNIKQLNIIEEFFVKLCHLSNYNFKLISYQYRDEYQIQLNLLNQSIHRLIHAIDFILHNEYLPKILQVFCYLYNCLSNQSVPGLDLLSFIDALNTPTNDKKKIFAHILVEILNEFYRNDLLELINNEQIIDLKTISTIHTKDIYQEIDIIYQQYQQIQYEYENIIEHQLSNCFTQMLFDFKQQFENIFQQEFDLKQKENDLNNYFCSNDLSAHICLSIIGQFIAKLRLAYNENENEKQISILNSNRKRSSVSVFYKSTSSIFSCI